MLKIISLFLIGFSTIYAQTSHINKDELYIEETSDDFSEIKRQTKVINLNIVLEQGMRKNYDERQRKTQAEILLNSIKDTKAEFWYPNLNLTLSTDSQRIATIKEGSNDSRTSKIPTGSFGLEVEDYTLFNWGKDYLTFKNSIETIERNKTILDETTREFRQELIVSYTKLLYLNEVVKLKKSQLRNASFVYRLNREKVPLKKVSKHGYYQARNDYLRAQDEYYQAKLAFEQEGEILAESIDDPFGIKYVLEDDFGYDRIKLSRAGAIKIAKKHSPLIKDAKLEKVIADRNYEIALRENLPLPKVTIDLGSYKHNFGSDSSLLYRTDTGNSIEVVATINATWSIYGDGGLLNRRKIATSKLNKTIKETNSRSVERNLQKQISDIYLQLKNIQDRLKIFKALVPTSKNRLDLALDRYLERKGSYTDFHLALYDSFNNQSTEIELKWTYFKLKVDLAKLIGLEDLPGEQFEQIIIGRQG